MEMKSCDGLKRNVGRPIKRYRNILSKMAGVMVSGISQNTSGILQDLLRSLQKEQGEVPEESVIAPAVLASGLDTVSISAQAAHSSQNMMSGNFAGATQQSRYIEASLAARQAEQQVLLQSHQVLAAAAAEMLAANGIDASRSSSEAGASMEMRRISNTRTLEASGRNLDEIGESIEQKAQEAVAPKDENGKPIEGLPTEGAGGASPMPEISGSNPVPVPEVTAFPVADVAQVSAPVPEVAASAVLRTPSINITV